VAREMAQQLKLANAVRDAIQEHANEHPDQWFATPANGVKRGLKIQYANGPYPMVVVSIGSSNKASQAVADGAPVERETLTLEVYGLAQSPEDPEGAAAELMADIRRALGSNRQLSIDGGEPVLPNGYIYFASTQIRHESPDGGNAIGECQVTLTVDYNWTADTA